MLLVAVMVNDGRGSTVTATVSVSVQPSAVAPVRVKVVELEGLTFTVFAVPPELQVYVLAPDPVKVMLAPLQIAEVGDAIDTVGNGLTVMSWLAVLVLVQPAALVPVTK